MSNTLQPESILQEVSPNGTFEEVSPFDSDDIDDSNEEFHIASLTMEVKVPKEDWINFLTRYNDVFGKNYIGYWARGIKRNNDLGWLLWVDDEKHDFGEEPDLEKATQAWEAKTELPPNWHRLDQELAIRAYLAGVKRWGEDWFDGDHGDALGYDVVIQLALFGEVRYG